MSELVTSTTGTAIDHFWQLVWGAIALKSEAFIFIKTLPLAPKAANNVVFLAGLSQAIAQSLILFINRVKPLRFILSMAISALLFAFGYFFWALSTWAMKNLFYPPSIPFSSVQSALGFAYAPQLFSFLVALPYFGIPIHVILSIWSFLALLLGLSTSLELEVIDASFCGVLGWFIVQVLQRTIGKPVANFGVWISNQAAGVKLVTDLKNIEKLLER